MKLDKSFGPCSDPSASMRVVKCSIHAPEEAEEQAPALRKRSIHSGRPNGDGRSQPGIRATSVRVGVGKVIVKFRGRKEIIISAKIFEARFQNYLIACELDEPTLFQR